VVKGKGKNLVGTTQLTISVTTGINGYLVLLSKTHLFGKTAAETASQIVAAEVRRLVTSGELAAYQARQPVDSEEESQAEPE